MDIILDYLTEINKSKNVSMIMSSHLGYTHKAADNAVVYEVNNKKITLQEEILN